MTAPLPPARRRGLWRRYRSLNDWAQAGIAVAAVSLPLIGTAAAIGPVHQVIRVPQHTAAAPSSTPGQAPAPAVPSPSPVTHQALSPPSSSHAGSVAAPVTPVTPVTTWSPPPPRAGTPSPSEFRPPATSSPSPAPSSSPMSTAALFPCSPAPPGGGCYAPGQPCPETDHGMRTRTASGDTIACLEQGADWRWTGE